MPKLRYLVQIIQDPLASEPVVLDEKVIEADDMEDFEEQEFEYTQDAPSCQWEPLDIYTKDHSDAQAIATYLMEIDEIKDRRSFILPLVEQYICNHETWTHHEDDDGNNVVGFTCDDCSVTFHSRDDLIEAPDELRAEVAKALADLR